MADNKQSNGRAFNLGKVKLGKSLQMTAPEQLGDDVRQATSNSIHQISPSAVFVAALTNSSGSVIRPLVLEHGKLTLIRLLELADTDKRRELEELYHLIRSTPAVGQHTASGFLSDKFWLKRPFYEHTLADKSLSDFDFLQMVQKLLELLHLMKQRNIVHGHINEANICFDHDNTLHLVDFGMSAAAGINAHDDFIAPEIKAGKQATISSDLYSLGKLINRRASGQFLEAHKDIVSRLLTPEPLGRPSLAEVHKALIPAEKTPQTTDSRLVSTATGAKLKSGKFINPSQVKIAVSSPAAEPDLEETQMIIPPAPPAQRSSDKTRPNRDTIRETGSGKSPLESVPIHVLILLVLIALSGLVIYRLTGSPAENANTSKENPVSLELMWTSRRPSLMKQVAERAVVEGDQKAAMLIINDALAGENRPQVASDFIRFAFDPRWEAQLSEDDRKFVLQVALAGLISIHTKPLKLEDRHPALILGVLGTLNDTALIASQLRSVPISRMLSLPAPYGPSFALLKAAGVENMAAPEARSLAILLFKKKIDLMEIDQFFGAPTGRNQLFKKLLVLKPVIAKKPDLAQPVLNALKYRRGSIAALINWFQEEKSAEWDRVPPQVKLDIISGSLSASDLQDAQLADLLKYPLKVIREKAAKELAKRYPQEQEAFRYLGSARNPLSRFQTLSFVAMLGMKGAAREAFIARWFKTYPEPSSIVELLIARVSVPAGDFFNLQAARYLSKRKWSATPLQLRKLTSHREELVRALAYFKLDPHDNEHRAILKNMARVEPSARLRKEIAEKLAGFKIN
ncbi:MAG: hypothetical protein D6719_02575 [Candidatus Dadabacteria bacterium]|nr:MAG: hypothetical protein D6719_02575 [Candidatus Dadabacteria bacterium]